ncbi:Fructose-bisphosphate aldolase class 1 [uncultured archaeon]|nr:Fructose-bisphosphate aldolase class 1 [uncultured archaeon]
MNIGQKTRLSRIVKDGKVLLLAMDQGMEHGPVDFNEKNIDPEFVLEIAKKGGFTGMALGKGVAYHYMDQFAGSFPLILKLNGRTNLVPKDSIYSSPVASVREAVRLGADAVGYTLYVGSPTEAQMFKEFGAIRAECEDYGMPTVVWAYPRGMHVKNEKDPAIVAYAARVALELGADIAKVNYTGSVESFKPVVQAAQRCKVIASGGSKQEEDKFISMAKDIISAGAAGFAVGRNVWQSEKGLDVAKQLHKVVWGK